MITLLVHKYPEAGTIARCLVDEGQACPEGYERMTQDEFDAWKEVQPSIDLPPEPLPEKQVSKRELFRLLGVDTWRAIEAACAGDKLVDQVVFEFYFAEFINVNDPDFLAGMGYLRMVGLLSEEQAAMIEGLRRA